MRGFATAKAAAERFGFNYNTYSQHERGHVGITRAAKDYARAYKVREAWLLTGEGEPDDIGPDALRAAFLRVSEADQDVQSSVIAYINFVLRPLEKSGATATKPTS